MTATALSTGVIGGGAVMSRSRLFHAYCSEVKYECLRMLRTPGLSIPLLALPLLIYVIIGVVLIGGQAGADPKVSRIILAGFAVFGVIGPGMFGFGGVLAVERSNGVLTLKRAFPMPPGAFLLAKMFTAIIFAAFVTLTLLAAAVTVGHVPLTFLQGLALFATNVIGVLPFCALGLFIGTISSGAAAQAVVNLVYFPMIYLSGLFFPLPHWLQIASVIWPATHLAQLVRHALGVSATGDSGTQVFILLATTFVFFILAMRFWRTAPK